MSGRAQVVHTQGLAHVLFPSTEAPEPRVGGDGDGGGAAVDGGVSEDVVDDLKQAFGTDFNVDDRLIQAILRGNCIAFVGSGFCHNETRMTFEDTVVALLVLQTPHLASAFFCLTLTPGFRTYMCRKPMMDC
jgi:hypothetical protein